MSAQTEIETILTEQLGVDRADVSADKSLAEDLNADSLDLTELMMTLEERFSIEVPQSEAEKLVTVGDIVRYIDQRRKPLAQ